jgi:hypothetical protein
MPLRQAVVHPQGTAVKVKAGCKSEPSHVNIILCPVWTRGVDEMHYQLGIRSVQDEQTIIDQCTLLAKADDLM